MNNSRNNILLSKLSDERRASVLLLFVAVLSLIIASSSISTSWLALAFAGFGISAYVFTDSKVVLLITSFAVTSYYNLINIATVSIVMGSIISAIIGLIILSLNTRKMEQHG